MLKLCWEPSSFFRVTTLFMYNRYPMLVLLITNQYIQLIRYQLSLFSINLMIQHKQTNKSISNSYPRMNSKIYFSLIPTIYPALLFRIWTDRPRKSLSGITILRSNYHRLLALIGYLILSMVSSAIPRVRQVIHIVI